MVRASGHDRDASGTYARRCGAKVCSARAPAQRMEIRRRGQWQTEERLLLPGYVFVGVEYSGGAVPSGFPCLRRHPVAWVSSCGEPQALDTREALRWRLDSEETLEPSRVLFRADGTWHVLDGPSVSVCRLTWCVWSGRQRRAYVVDGAWAAQPQRIRFGVVPVDGDAADHEAETRSAAGAGAEDLRREAEGAAGAVRAVRVGDAGERPPRLPVPPLRAAQYIGKCETLNRCENLLKAYF